MDDLRDKVIEEMKRVIISKFDPEKIILFGSCAKNKVGKNSDIDLFIIRETNLNIHKRIMEINDVIPHSFPVDIIVYTPKEYKKYKDNKWSFLYRVEKEGEIIYERK